MQSAMRTSARPALTASSTRGARPSAVLCKAQKPEEGNRMALPMATLVATALLSGAFMPEEALAAKSGGRIGGSSGFKSRRMDAPAQRSTTVVNNTTVIAPPVMAPPLFGGFGYGYSGFGFMPSFGFGMPFPFFGGLLQVFFLVAIVSVIFNVVRAVIGSGSNSNDKKKDDGWGDL